MLEARSIAEIEVYQRNDTPRYALVVRPDSKKPDYCLLCDVDDEVREGAIVIAREDDDCMPREPFNRPRVVDEGDGA